MDNNELSIAYQAGLAQLGALILKREKLDAEIESVKRLLKSLEDTATMQKQIVASNQEKK